MITKKEAEEFGFDEYTIDYVNHQQQEKKEKKEEDEEDDEDYNETVVQQQHLRVIGGGRARQTPDYKYDSDIVAELS